MPCGYSRRSRVADGVAAMSRFWPVWKCAGRRRLRQAEPRGCYGQNVSESRGGRSRKEGGAALRTGGTSAKRSQPVEGLRSRALTG